jgi:transcriptional regulator with XRE-family HTH domain
MVRQVTEVRIAHKRALNQAIIHAGRIPAGALLAPEQFVRALRSALRMSQGQLALRSGVPKAHVVRLEAGKIDARLSTLRRLLDALFCDLLVLPRARLRPGEAVARRRLEKPTPYRYRWRLWDD